MKIMGTSLNKVMNIYEKNNNKVQKNKEVVKKDSLEISKAGKSLSDLLQGDLTSSADKIERIKKEIDKGTYNIDSKLVAKKIFDVMKGRGI